MQFYQIMAKTRGGVLSMSQKQIDILDMQCWVFRMAQKKWSLSPQECIKIFREHDIFGFIEKCYEILHLSSYQCVLDDIEEMLHNKGVFVC